MKLYTKYIFEKFDIQRLYAQIYDFNGQSMNVLEKAGYIPEAILKKGFIKNGVVGDLFQYVIVRGEQNS
ncbi:GNAT family protein [Algoriphagus halophilus]